MLLSFLVAHILYWYSSFYIYTLMLYMHSHGMLMYADSFVIIQYYDFLVIIFMLYR